MGVVNIVRALLFHPFALAIGAVSADAGARHGHMASVNNSVGELNSQRITDKMA